MKDRFESIDEGEGLLKTAVKNADFKACERLLFQVKQLDENQLELSVKDALIEGAKEWVNKNPPFSNMLKTLEIIQSYIKITLPMLPGDIFLALLFECPDLAKRIIEESVGGNYKFPNISPLNKYTFLGLSKTTDHAFSECINLLSKTDFITQTKWIIDKTLPMMIHNDCALTVFALQKQYSQKVLDEILRWDSVATFNKLYPYWLTTNQLQHDNTILSTAVHSRGYKCVELLLTSNSGIQRDDLIREAVLAGDGRMVFILTNKNYALAASYLFADTVVSLGNMGSTSDPAEIEKKLRHNLFKLLRFTSLDIVEKLFNAFLEEQKSSVLLPILLKTYITVKQEFLESAPFFSRYSDIMSLEELSTRYGNLLDKSNLDSVVRDDIAYGKKRSQLADTLSAKITDAVKPEKEPFTSLPMSSSGKQTAAVLLEEITKWFDKNISQNNQFKNKFKSMRSEAQVYATPCTTRYEWSAPLVHSTFLHSQANDVQKEKNQFPSALYELKYRNDTVNIVGTNFIYGVNLYFHHGWQELHSTWRDIENIWEKAWEMKIVKPHQYASKEEHVHYKKTLTDFYETVAELAWLIGNSQPLIRGSGTVAEVLLALIHRHHGLQPPILRLEFPQLDVLDIIFPLSDYKAFFPYFFEPSTIPEHLRRTEMSSLPIIEQMQQLYYELNQAKPHHYYQSYKATLVDYLTRKLASMQNTLPKNLENYEQLEKHLQSVEKMEFTDNVIENLQKTASEIKVILKNEGCKTKGSGFYKEQENMSLKEFNNKFDDSFHLIEIPADDGSNYSIYNLP